LRVEWLAGSNPGRAAVIANGIAALAESTANVAAGGRQVHAIEHVEHLNAQLRVQPLFDGDVLEKREVHITIAGGPKNVAANGPEAAVRWICK